MKKVRIVYGSSQNISVTGSYIVEVGDDSFNEEGELTDKARNELWQDAVNEYMNDTYVEAVKEEES